MSGLTPAQRASKKRIEESLARTQARRRARQSSGSAVGSQFETPGLPPMPGGGRETGGDTEMEEMGFTPGRQPDLTADGDEAEQTVDLPDMDASQGLSVQRDPFNTVVLKQNKNYNQLLLLNAERLGLSKGEAMSVRDREAIRLLQGINTSVYPTSLLPGGFVPGGGDMQMGKDAGYQGWIIGPSLKSAYNKGLYKRRRKPNLYSINPGSGIPWLWEKNKSMPPRGVNNSRETNAWWCPKLQS